LHPLAVIFMTISGAFFLNAGAFAADEAWPFALDYGFAAILTTASMSRWMPRFLPAVLASVNLALASSLVMDLSWHELADVASADFPDLAIVGLWTLVLSIVPGFDVRRGGR